MIAVLGPNLEATIGELQRRGDVEHFNRATGHGEFKSGRSFRVACSVEQLQGVCLTDYIVVRGTADDLVQFAKTRMR